MAKEPRVGQSGDPPDGSGLDNGLSARAIGRLAFDGALRGGIAVWMLVSLVAYVTAMVAQRDPASAWVSMVGWIADTPYGYWPSIWVGALLLSLSNVVWGVREHAAKLRREQAYRRLTDSGAGSPATAAMAIELGEKLERAFPCCFSLELENVLHMQRHGLALSLCDASTLAGDKGRQTIAYYESGDRYFPRFDIQPGDSLERWLGKLSGLRYVEFPEHPGFSSHYHLMAADPEHARCLFDAAILNELGRHKGLTISSGGKSLVVCRRGRLCEANEWEVFAREAAGIFRLFDDAARRSGLTAGQIRAAEAALAPVRRPVQPASAEAAVRQPTLSRADVDAFIAQRPPRELPRDILARVDDGSAGMLIWFGGIFAGGGALISYMLATSAAPVDGAAIGWVIGLLLLVAGCLMTWFAVPSLIRKKRLCRLVLRDGELALAHVVSVEDAHYSVDGQDRFFMTVRYLLDGRDVVASCRISGAYAIERAQQLARSGMPATILYSPAAPHYVMFVDNLLAVPAAADP